MLTVAISIYFISVICSAFTTYFLNKRHKLTAPENLLLIALGPVGIVMCLDVLIFQKRHP